MALILTLLMITWGAILRMPSRSRVMMIRRFRQLGEEEFRAFESPCFTMQAPFRVKRAMLGRHATDSTLAAQALR